MKRTTITSTDFLKKPYTSPLMNVVKINSTDIICTSGGTEKLQENNFDWED